MEGALHKQRQPALEPMEALLKSLRLQGIEETTLRQFVCKYSGAQWEEFFEALFGYDNKLQARAEWGKTPQGNPRPKFQAWRERLTSWADDLQKGSQEERDRKHLQRVEVRNLQAQGVELLTARKQAARMAEAMVDQAAEQRRAATSALPPANFDPALLAAKKRERMKAMLAEARTGKYEAKQRRMIATAFSPITFVLGPQVRFLAGLALLAGCLMWAQQNDLLSASQLANTAANVRAGNADDLQVTTSQGLSSLPLSGWIFNSFYPGVAGLLLVCLGLFSGWRMSLFAWPAAAVIVLGPHLQSLGIPDFGLPSLLFLAIGLGIGAAGFFLGQSPDE